MAPRKRKRSENTSQEDTDITASIPDLLVRDDTYYRENGDCVIRVGSVLFKIHRILLERDASAFLNMFSMPQGNDPALANSDNDPLVLFDDVDDFRALCWIIYALPTVYMQQSKLETADMKNLVSLYLIAQKYHFDAHESFARDLLRQHCSAIQAGSSPNPNYLFSCPESRLEDMLRIAAFTEETSVADAESFLFVLQKVWIIRLKDTNESAAFALGVGEELGLRDFMAGLYYLELTRMKSELVEGSTAYVHPVSDLTPHQKLILYQGYWSLRQYWIRRWDLLQKKSLNCSDKTEHACRFIWQASWERFKADEFSSDTFDPLQLLANIASNINEYGAEWSETKKPHCAIRAIEKMQVSLKKNLAEHFLGPLPSSSSDA
ncbi:hypothetical protein BDN70DRAFT_918313 [Pholiota conissans]|uniref:BTB domain-containing protein n=1 Tax=Pholiota conissans TaxID=109636 RepID=A0A9P6CY14_9AGAR|nr:hypothetical protein BDN70DRAFT_918313 [Pholiota conissans]